MKCTDTKGRRLGTLRKLDSRLLGLLTEEAVAAEKKRDLQIRVRLRVRVRVRLLSARGLGLSCRRHCCCRRQLATKIFQ